MHWIQNRRPTMKTIGFAVAMIAAGFCLVLAADKEPAEELVPPLESSEAYRVDRVFAMEDREDPVGVKITEDRAFWGAPPVMPHSFSSEQDGRFCLTCHATENRVELRQQAISPVPHAEFSQCQQCHVRQVDTEIVLLGESNSFVGLDFPGKGTRAHDYAPPTMPHKTFMRDNCMSCHGPSGEQRIQTPHPFRSQCLQCHVPDASKNYTWPYLQQ